MTNTSHRPYRYRADRRAPHGLATNLVAFLIAAILVGILAVSLGHLFAGAVGTITSSIPDTSTTSTSR